MRDHKIISKGKYTNSSSAVPVSVSNYVILEEGERRFVMLKFANARAEAVSSMKLKFTQLDAGKEEITSSVMSFDDVNGTPSGKFVLSKKIEVDPDCEGFVAEVLSADYGNYNYTKRGDDVSFNYVADTSLNEKAVKKLRHGLHGKKSKVATRKFPSPKIVGALACILLLMFAVAFTVHIMVYRMTQTKFSVDDIQYRFASNINSENGDVVITGYTGKSSTLTIPAVLDGHKVVAVDEGAFKGRKTIAKITFSGPVTIGDGAFENCSNLESVNFDEITEVGELAFAYTAIKKIESDVLTKIGTSAFSECERLTSVSITSPVLAMGTKAFEGSGVLSDVNVTSSVVFDGDSVFNQCNALTSVGFGEFNTDAEREPVTLTEAMGNVQSGYALSIGKLGVMPESFASALTMKSFEAKTYASDSISASAFEGCGALTSVKVPANVTVLGEACFKDTALASFDMTNLKEVGSYAFSGSAIQTVTVPESSVPCAFGEGVFKDCTALTRADVAMAGNKISTELFSGCTALNTVTFADTFKPHEIETAAFKDCTSLQTVAIPNSVQYIYESAFEGCESLRVIVIPDSAQSIGKNAFKNCTAMANVALGSGLNAIGEGAFEGSGVTELNVPVSVRTIAKGAFKNTSALESLTIPFIGGSASARDGYFSYVFGGAQASDVNAIPSSLASLTLININELPEQFLSGCVNIREVNLPDGITAVPSRAFYGCSALTSVRLPSELETVGESAFENCGSLNAIIIPDTLNELGLNAFKGCNSITSIKLPFIGDSKTGETNKFMSYLFGGTSDEDNFELVPTSLASVAITGWQTVPDRAFMNCTSIESVSLGASLSAIGEDAFNGCAKLVRVNDDAADDSAAARNVKFDGIVSIGDRAFYGCSSITAVILPTSFENLGESVFASCTSLSDITVPFTGNGSDIHEFGYLFGYNSDDINHNITVPGSLKTVTLTKSINAVKEGTFANCGNVTDIVLPGGITAFEKQSFANCASLVNVTIPDTLKTIGERAFAGCAQLSEMIVPSSVNIIGVSAFENCTSIRRAVIPNSVTVIEQGLFAGCDNMREISLPYIGDGLTARFGYVFTAADSVISNYNDNVPALIKVTITKDITSVMPYAFTGCRSIQEINLPNTVQSIGRLAFSGCTSLKTLDTGSMSTLVVIGDEAFALCSVIENITIPESVADFGDNVFNYCYRLYEVENLSATVSHDRIRNGINNILHVYDGREDGVLAMEKAYAGVEGARYTIALNPEDDTWYLVGYPAAANLTLPTEFEYGETFISEYSIANHLFYNNKTLTYIKLSAAVNGLGQETFKNNPALKHVDMSEAVITEIPVNCFYDCRALRFVDIPDTVQQIESDAFYRCDSLYAIRIPSELTYLSPTAFSLNSKLYVIVNASEIDLSNENWTNTARVFETGDMAVGLYNNAKVDYVRCGDDWYVVGSDKMSDGLVIESFDAEEGLTAANIQLLDVSFEGNRVLKTVTLGSGVVSFTPRLFAALPNIESVAMEQSSITEIYTNEFENKNLTAVTLPGTLVTIGDNAFSGCSALSTLPAFPETLETIGNYAFANTALSKVELLGNVTSVGEGAFSYCLALREVILPDSLIEIQDYTFDGCARLTSLTLPTTLETIGERAFASCVELDGVTFPASLETIKSSAFNGCLKLTDVTLPGIVSIGDQAFFGCEKLITLSLAYGAETIGDQAFASCGVLGSVSLPDSVTSVGTGAFNADMGLMSLRLSSAMTSIEDYTFQGCSMLTNVEIPSSVRRIGAHAFDGCVELTDVTFNTGLNEIAEYAFCNAGKLTAVNLPNGLLTVGNYAFAECVEVAELTFPDTVTHIGNGAFQNNVKVAAVSLPRDIVSIGNGAFTGCIAMRELVIPSGATRSTFGDYCFNNCYQLYEVFNLSSLPITIGSYEYGGVAESAQMIYRSLNDERVVAVTADQIFVKKSEGWRLTKMLNLYPESPYKLPESFTFNGRTVNEYGLAAHSMNGFAVSQVILPADTTYVDVNAFAGCAYYVEVFTEADAEEWERLNVTLLSGVSSIRTFVDCVHDESTQWTYRNGSLDARIHYDAYSPHVTLAPTCTTLGEREYRCEKCRTPLMTEPVPMKPHTLDDEVIVVAPTCTTEGLREHYCRDCEVYLDPYQYGYQAVIPALGHDARYEEITAATCTSTGRARVVCAREDCGEVLETVVLEKLPHDAGVDGKCVNCGAQGTFEVTVNEWKNTSGLWDNDAAYPFAFTNGTGLHSTNTSTLTTSTIVFTADRDMTVVITATTRGRTDYNALHVVCGDTDHVVTGERTIMLTLRRGDTIEFTFELNRTGSQSKGSITEFVIYDSEQ